jgi:hypothetical protein
VALRDNLVLLGATALLTGLLVPVVTGRMDDRRLARQRRAQEDLARDSTFIEAQIDLLSRLSTDLWRLAGKTLSVSYYATSGSREQFAEAWHTYDSTSFDELFELRAHVSRSQRLLSNEAQEQLAELHRWWFGDLDVRLTAMAREATADDRRWGDFHTSTMVALFERIDLVLGTIARDVGVIERRELLHERDDGRVPLSNETP